MFAALALFSLLAAPALGRSLEGHLPFIINGDDVDYAGKYPYQASLQFFGSHSCGGAIISDEFVLSAAHCCSGTGYYSMVVGAHDIKTMREGQVQRFSLVYAKRNPGYGRGTGLNEADVCIVKLNGTIDFDANPYAGTIALPNEDDGMFVGADCIITGWGNTKIGSTGSPNILQEAKTRPLTVAECKRKIATNPYFDEDDVNELHICIGSFGKEGSCHGDSGGPLACKLNGKQVLAGVTSWGDPSCNPIYPTQYTRITAYREWIKTNTGI